MFDCPNLAVPMSVMQHVVRVESSQNPYAIGVVGGRLARQPRNLSEAVATARQLEQQGFNFSLGIAQVNRYNLAKYGLSSYQQAFEICPNLQAGSRILNECYNRARDWGKAFSCYYSGNFVTGYKHGYVQKVFASMRQGGQVVAPVGGGIAVYGDANRRVRVVQSYPAYSSAMANTMSPTIVNARYLEDPKPANQVVSDGPVATSNQNAMVDMDAVEVTQVTKKQAPARDPAFVY